MTRRITLRRYGPAYLVLLLFVAGVASGEWRRFSFGELQLRQAEFTALCHAHPLLSLAAYMAAFVVLVFACVPGPGLMAVAGGLFFGGLVGGSAALVSLVAGSTLVFIACRSAFGDWLARRAGPTGARLARAFEERPFSYLLTLRLVPVVPYFAPTVAAALAGASVRDLVLATLVGSAPVNFILAYLGVGLRRTLALGKAPDASLFLRPEVIAPLAGLTLLAASSLAWRVAQGARARARARTLASLPHGAASRNGPQMAAAAPAPQDSSPSSDRLRLWPGGLSARLLLLTILIVVFANLLILPPNLAAFEERWFLDRLRAAELATLVEETAPNGVTERVSEKLLAASGVVSVALQVDNERRLIMQAPRLARTPTLVDLRNTNTLSWLAPFQTLVGGGDRMIRVMAQPRFRPGEFVEIVVPDASLRRELIAQLGRLMGVAAFTSIMAGAVVYLSLNLFLVLPMQRITRAMERFRANPEDLKAHIKPSRRRDEIGRAERELDRMQVDLRAALASRARLAALGEAVAKINHDLRNMLTSAQLASQRLARSGDPNVTSAMPRLERALDRAITLASNVLTFGKSVEPAPEKRPTPLRAALEAAAEDAGLAADVRLSCTVDPSVTVEADAEQLHRILVNLMRNARDAIDAAGDEKGGGKVSVTASEADGMSVIRIADTGPGLPERAQANLFQPFAGSTRRGGAGLGLAIARELAEGHGGSLSLIETSPAGAVFELRLPLAAAEE